MHWVLEKFGLLLAICSRDGFVNICSIHSMQFQGACGRSKGIFRSFLRQPRKKKTDILLSTGERRGVLKIQAYSPVLDLVSKGFQGQERRATQSGLGSCDFSWVRFFGRKSSQWKSDSATLKHYVNSCCFSWIVGVKKSLKSWNNLFQHFLNNFVDFFYSNDFLVQNFFHFFK